MKKFLLLGAILTGLAIYSSIQAVNYISQPAVCIDCHGIKYTATANGSILPSHTNSSITCISCHSGKGMQAQVEAMKIVVEAKIIKEIKPSVNQLFKANFSFNNSFNFTRFKSLRVDCSKCHPDSELKGEMHANKTACNLCHFAHTKLKINFQATGISTHKNLKCTACHGTETEIQIPSCTKCHEPHVKEGGWDNVVCLGCHNDAHVPTRSITFTESTPKEMCQGCHASEYQNLTSSGGKHNLLSTSCANCHPKHGAKMSCLSCHRYRQKHAPHRGNTCNLCHSRGIGCTTCHDPHNPFGGLPKPATNEQIGEIAKQRARTLK